jgi:hypothetical protein
MIPQSLDAHPLVNLLTKVALPGQYLESQICSVQNQHSTVTPGPLKPIEPSSSTTSVPSNSAARPKTSSLTAENRRPGEATPFHESVSDGSPLENTSLFDVLSELGR